MMIAVVDTNQPEAWHSGGRRNRLKGRLCAASRATAYIEGGGMNEIKTGTSKSSSKLSVHFNGSALSGFSEESVSPPL